MLISTTVISVGSVGDVDVNSPEDVDKKSGFTKEQCEDLGIPFNPETKSKSEENVEVEREVTLWFRSEDFRRIEHNSESPFLVLDGNIYYELKSSQEVTKILMEINKLNNK